MLIRKINKRIELQQILIFLCIAVLCLSPRNGPGDIFLNKFLRKFVSLLKKLKTNCINSADICQVQLRPD